MTDLTADDVRNLFLHRLGIRLGPETCAYVLRRLRPGQGAGLPHGPVPVMGGDARTGVPVRLQLDPALLSSALNPESRTLPPG